MKIILKDQYKSLRPFESDELNKLTVITGKNGSGKSQLLNLIENKFKNEPAVISIRLELSPVVNRIQSEGIIKDKSTIIDHQQWKSIIKKQLDNFRSLSSSAKNLVSYIIENNLEHHKNDPGIPNTKLISEKIEYKEILAKVFTEIRKTALIPVEQVNTNTERIVLRNIFNKKNIEMYKFIKELCSHTGKTDEELIDADFYNSPIQEQLIDSNDLFSSQIELIFYNYAKRRDSNRKNYFYKKEDGETNNAVSDVEFIKNYTPPWKVINEILEKHNVDFYFKGIEKTEFTIEVPIDFKLVKKSSNEAISFSDLSSGEKVIIGLILKLFTSEYYGKELSFPELLILDEPDAHLHPEMSKLLLDVLEDTFVNKYNINVILTTHSPSTIALSSENQIYQLTNGVYSALKKISKDTALNLLVSFIPTLSIDYKNHRQVFVESPTDVMYYQTLHDKHTQNNKYSYKLYFISNSAGKGNCSQVYKIVNEIRTSGNSTSYGIVDWDLKNIPTQFIHVHGLSERYSIENFILDPIYIICLLIDLNNAHGISEKIGINMSYNQYFLGNENSEMLQNVIKYFFLEFENKFSTCKYESEKVTIEYLNGRKLEIPKWYLEMKGHDIVDKIKIIFSALEGKFRSEGEIQKVLIIIMAKSYPFVPLTSIKTIETISNNP